MKYLIFQDLPDDKKFGFYLFPGTPGYIAPESIFPGLFGYSPMYVRHLRSPDFFVISQTSYELTPHRTCEILHGAKVFLSKELN